MNKNYDQIAAVEKAIAEIKPELFKVLNVEHFSFF